jgi:ribonuclease D
LNPPSKISYLYIDNQSALDNLNREIKNAERIAINTEADSLHQYYEKVCLIQLTIKSQNFLIDPLADINFSEFLKLLSGKLLILHGADYDLRMLYAWMGFEPASEIFDTMIAAQLLGMEQIGLVSLVEKFFNISLSKKGQKSNWARRPLTETQLQYACNDTRYLEKLTDKLSMKLQRLGRSEWHRESCARIVQTAVIEKQSPDPDKIWRVRGSSRLEPKQLEFLKRLWHWRESEAKKADSPPFKIMMNHLMIELAIWAAENHEHKIETAPKLPRNCINQRLKNMKRALKKAANTPQSQWPQHPKPPRYKPYDTGVLALFETLRSKYTEIANDLGLELSIIANRATILTIAKEKCSSLDQMVKSGRMMQWQADLLQPALEEILDK